MSEKYVYRFSKDFNEGDRNMREILGGKGANLAEMCKIGLEVPLDLQFPPLLAFTTSETATSGSRSGGSGQRNCGVA